MDLQNLDQFHSLEELVSYQGEVQGRLSAINTEFAGQPLPPEVREEFAGLNDQFKDIEKRTRELEARQRIIERVQGSERNTERELGWDELDTPANRGSLKERDIYDLSQVRFDPSRPEASRTQLRDRAMRAVELTTFPHVPGKNQDDVRSHLQNLVDNYDTVSGDRGPGEIARRILQTGSPAYKRGFMKYLAGRENSWSTEERTAMAVGAGATGGYAIVYQLDPTFIPTSNLAVNPFRAIGNVSTIAGTNEWRGVTSGAVVAAYAAEAAETTDNSPTLAQPALVVQRAQCFIPVSIELTQDLPALQGELAKLIQDAKDTLEATAFTTGVGTTVNPQGVLVGATNTVTAGGTASFAVSDVYALENALAPRFRQKASFVGNRFIFQKVRQFDTTGFGALWTGISNALQQGLPNEVPTPGGLHLPLIGYPTYEDSAMAAVLTTGSLVLTLGDYNYFKIVDRIGLDIEVIPHLFGQTANYPTGQRGVLAYWRNTSRVLSAAAFQTLKTG